MNPRFRLQPTELAGWLFADLLLVLAVLGLASQTPLPKIEPTPSPSPTPTTERTLDLKPRSVTFTVDGSGLLSNSSSAKKELRALIEESKLSRLDAEGREAGMALIFSGATSGSSSCLGSTELSKKVFKVLKTAVPNLVSVTTINRPFIQAGCDARNKVKIDLYIYRI